MSMSPPNRSPASPIIIAGAGIGGLTAALAFLRFGFKVIVCEQTPVLGEVGAEVQISANGSRVLTALGLEPELRRVWCEPEGKQVRLWSSGQTWKLFDLGAQSVERYGAPYFMCHRADLHSLLASAVRACDPAAIRLGARCATYLQDDDGVSVALANGEQLTGAVLIGADGVHSGIRNALFGDDRPTFSGCVAWRGLVPIACLPPRLARNVGSNWIGPEGTSSTTWSGVGSSSTSSGSSSAVTGRSNPGHKLVRLKNVPPTSTAGTMTSTPSFATWAPSTSGRCSLVSRCRTGPPGA